MLSRLAVFILVSFTSSLFGHPPWGLVFDAEGNLYIPDIARNGKGTLWKLTPDKELIPLAKDFHCHNVNYVQGNIYAAHGEGMHILVKWQEDKPDTLIREPDLDQFFGGNCAVSANGNIYFSNDHYIWQKFPDGRIEKASEQYLVWNQAIFIDDEECIYAPDIGIEGGALYRLSPGGNAEKLASNLISDVGRPRDRHSDILLGMAQGEDGERYICELAGGRVIQIGPDGEKHDFYRSQESWFPVSICFRGESAFIVEYARESIYRTRVMQLNADGDPEIYFEFP